MKAVVGLGNPGPEYEATRHNLGFRVVEAFSARRGVHRFRARGEVLEARVRVGGEEVLVVKPLTYMNRSGAVVRDLVRRGTAGADLLVAHDDLDLDLGTVRVKVGGGHGGHNGLRSILEEGSPGDFVRIRLGIRRPEPGMDAAEWVLAPFAADERPVAEEMIEKGADAVDAVLRLGPARAMNSVNRRPADTLLAPAPAGSAGDPPGPTTTRREGQ